MIRDGHGDPVRRDDLDELRESIARFQREEDEWSLRADEDRDPQTVESVGMIQAAEEISRGERLIAEGKAAYRTEAVRYVAYLDQAWGQRP